MPAYQKTEGFSFPGYSFGRASAATLFDVAVSAEVTLPALNSYQTGQLTTRTGNDDGIVTLSTGHGIISTNKVDVYWTGGRRFGMTATVDSNAVTVAGGAGNNLPELNTEGVTVVKQTAVNINFDGDDSKVVAVFYRNPSTTTAKAHVDFQDTGNASIEDVDLVHETANTGLDNIWDISAGDTNDFTGNRITQAHASHNATTAGTLYILQGHDAS